MTKCMGGIIIYSTKEQIIRYYNDIIRTERWQVVDSKTTIHRNSMNMKNIGSDQRRFKTRALNETHSSSIFA